MEDVFSLLFLNVIIIISLLKAIRYIITIVTQLKLASNYGDSDTTGVTTFLSKLVSKKNATNMEDFIQDYCNRD